MEQIELHQTFGKPTAMLEELRNRALQLLSPETIQEIQGREKDQLVLLNYTLGLRLRNLLDLWHTTVYNKEGQQVHPDDVTLAILHEIWQLNQ